MVHFFRTCFEMGPLGFGGSGRSASSQVFPKGRSSLLTGKSFLLTVGLCCLRSIGLVFFTYGLVFFAYDGN